jgi:hypothetical protein
MNIQVSQGIVYFELNYAKKGVLYPPKAGLPPLIGGSRSALFLYKSLKKALILS